MDFCLAKSRNPPASAIASNTVAEFVSGYDPGFETMPRMLNFWLLISVTMTVTSGSEMKLLADFGSQQSLL